MSQIVFYFTLLYFGNFDAVLTLSIRLNNFLLALNTIVQFHISKFVDEQQSATDKYNVF